MRKQGIDFQVIKPERHNQNPAEGIISRDSAQMVPNNFSQESAKRFLGLRHAMGL